MKQVDWIDPVARIIEECDGRGGILIVFPEYRPDRYAALAGQLQLHPFDYRAEVMSRHGWDADRLSLEDLDQTLATLAARCGTLVNNVEALLSTKNPLECADWMTRFLDMQWKHILLVPIVINAAMVPSGHRRVHRVPDGALNEQSFLNRLTY